MTGRSTAPPVDLEAGAGLADGGGCEGESLNEPIDGAAWSTAPPVDLRWRQEHGLSLAFR